MWVCGVWLGGWVGGCGYVGVSVGAWLCGCGYVGVGVVVVMWV